MSESSEFARLAAEARQQVAEKYALGLLNEECGEAVQMIGKAMRFGIDTPGPEAEPYNGASARANLEKEAGDILAALKYARLSGLLNRDTVQRFADAKFAKLTDPQSRDAHGNRLAPPLPQEKP